jgi:hypothetical protein
MKTKLLFILFLFISTLSYSQQYHKAKTFSFCTIKRDDKWTPWSEKELIDANIEVDSARKIITIYSNKLQTYIIYKTERFVNDNEIIYWYNCEDKDNILCSIELVLDRNGYNKNEFEIKYADLKIRYELK